jgi:hypothetical protein
MVVMSAIMKPTNQSEVSMVVESVAKKEKKKRDLMKKRKPNPQQKKTVVTLQVESSEFRLPSLTELPWIVLMYMFSYLDAQSLLRVSMVCKEMYVNVVGNMRSIFVARAALTPRVYRTLVLDRCYADNHAAIWSVLRCFSLTSDRMAAVMRFNRDMLQRFFLMAKFALIDEFWVELTGGNWVRENDPHLPEQFFDIVGVRQAQRYVNRNFRKIHKCLNDPKFFRTYTYLKQKLSCVTGVDHIQLCEWACDCLWEQVWIDVLVVLVKYTRSLDNCEFDAIDHINIYRNGCTALVDAILRREGFKLVKKGTKLVLVETSPDRSVNLRKVLCAV